VSLGRPAGLAALLPRQSSHQAVLGWAGHRAAPRPRQPALGAAHLGLSSWAAAAQRQETARSRRWRPSPCDR
jgi:hypothetical protein